MALVTWLSLVVLLVVLVKAVVDMKVAVAVLVDY
jgi:hypothetical protein